MEVECIREYNYIPKPKERHTPDDHISYIIPETAIQDTEKVLNEYGLMTPSNEGMVYWAGARLEDLIIVRMVIAPDTESNFGRVSTSRRSNFDVIGVLNEYSHFEVAQVHTHPDDWVDHSWGDDMWAAFKIEGLLSILVPNYCRDGMLPLSDCGVHRFAGGGFIRLSDEYVNGRFRISGDEESTLKDLRK
ncbi:MAG: hypothetical protein ACW99U_18710 [Candidatus Thorarchaeota archaeon]|jgi:hypothetical protein